MGLSDDLGFSSTPPDVVGLFHDTLLVCGSGRGLWGDIAAYTMRRGQGVHGEPTCDTMAVKQAGMYLPWRFQHWAGAHGERFQYMAPLRREGYYFRGMDKGQRGVHPQKLGAKIHSEKAWPLVDHVWGCKMVGTSALFAVRVGLMLGYDEVVLCGVPLDTTGRFYDAPWDKGVDLNVVDMAEWEQFLPFMKGRVKSMSGRTRDLLGGI